MKKISFVLTAIVVVISIVYLHVLSTADGSKSIIPNLVYTVSIALTNCKATYIVIRVKMYCILLEPD